MELVRVIGVAGVGGWYRGVESREGGCRMGSLVDTGWGGVEWRALCAVGSMRVEDWRG